LLCASIGWVNHKRKELLKKGIKVEDFDYNSLQDIKDIKEITNTNSGSKIDIRKNIQIFYSSRTHSQLSNVNINTKLNSIHTKHILNRYKYY